MKMIHFFWAETMHVIAYC